MKRILLLILLIMSTAGASDWAQSRNYLNNTGITTDSAPLTNVTNWTYTTNNAIEGDPVIANGTVYVSSDDGYVYAINATDGSFIWQYLFTGAWVPGANGTTLGAPGVGGGRVFISGYNVYAITALNQTDGTHLWNITPASLDGYMSPKLYNDLVVIADNSGILYALNVEDGSTNWTFTPAQYSEYMTTTVAISGEVVYLGTNNVAQFYAVNVTDGSQIWNYTPGNDVFSSAAVTNDKVIFGCYDKKVYALNTDGGGLNWTYTTGGIIAKSSPSIYNGLVIIGSADNHLYALNLTDGSQVWNYTTGGFVSLSSPAVSGDGVVYFGSLDNRAYAVNATDGAFIWSYQTGDDVNSPAISNGLVVFTSWDGNVSGIGFYSTASPDIISPNITTNYPTANISTRDGTPTWNFTVVDDQSTTLNCTVYIDGVVNVNNGSVLNGTVSYLTPASDLTLKWRNWTLNCSDSAGNSDAESSYIQIRNYRFLSVMSAVTICGFIFRARRGRRYR